MGRGPRRRPAPGGGPCLGRSWTYWDRRKKASLRVGVSPTGGAATCATRTGDSGTSTTAGCVGEM
eukprot:1440786-Alexandrium_andersonii.AAC.1